MSLQHFFHTLLLFQGATVAMPVFSRSGGLTAGVCPMAAIPLLLTAYGL
jgi:hypothetical protein